MIKLFLGLARLLYHAGIHSIDLLQPMHLSAQPFDEPRHVHSDLQRNAHAVSIDIENLYRSIDAFSLVLVTLYRNFLCNFRRATTACLK